MPMNDAHRLTVIVPVYKVEDTLDRCLHSILTQDCGGLHVILVDDGSPDACPRLCDEWARRDSRVQVIHKANGGLSEARNAGLRRAEGAYVTFVDSDDYLLAGTYRAVLEEMEKGYDFVEFPVCRVDRQGHERCMEWGRRVYTRPEDYWYGCEGYVHTYACNKVFRRSLFDGLAFPAGRLFEDAWLMPKLLERCSCFATTERGGYVYEVNDAGITCAQETRGLPMLLESHLQSGFGLSDSRYYLELANIQINVYRLTGAVSLPPRRVRVGRLKGIKGKMKGILLNLLGLKLLCKLFRLLSAIR